MSTEPRTGFSPGGLDRSSFDILYSCFGTLFFCTWTVVNLNLPAKNERMGIPLLRKLKWMVITSIASEITTCLALGQFLAARSLLRNMKGAHARSLERPLDAPAKEITLSECFYIAMGGYWLQYHDGNDQRELGLLVSPRVAVALEHYRFFFPESGTDSITEKDHRDQLGIGLTTLQIMWLVIQSISRRESDLPISQLELATIAIVFAAIMNYTIWWSKPQDPERVVLNLTPGTLFPEPLQRLLDDRIIQEKDLEPSHRAKNTVAPLRILRDLRDPDVDAINLSPVLGLLAIASVMFCGIHFAAWNWSFASEIEKWLWRVCSISCLVSSLGVVFCLWLILHETEKWVITMTKLFLFLFVVFYVLARACIVVEVFVAFRSMPASLYVIQPWTRYFPHF
jgi:hypothetical protein